jgi:hypothetical protein
MGMAGNNGGGKAASQLAKQHQQTDRRNEPERDMAEAGTTRFRFADFLHRRFG